MSKDRLLNKVTHAILETKSKEIAAKTGIHGVLSLCFGPGDTDCISQIHLVKAGNRPSWRPPHVEVTIDGRVKKLPVYTGRVAQEIGEWSQQVYETIKKQIGRVQYGRQYRIAGGKATEESKPENTVKAS